MRPTGTAAGVAALIALMGAAAGPVGPVAGAARVTGDLHRELQLRQEEEEHAGMNPWLVAQYVHAHHNWKEDMAEQKRLREEEERRRLEEERRREEYLRQEEHRLSNLRDCAYKEEWEPATDSCTAKCGGGVATKVLKARVIVAPQDEWGYGKECPPGCSMEDRSGCGEKRYEPCALEPCVMGCSFIDLGNPLPGGGVPVEWSYKDEDGSGECVFQLWKVLEEEPFRAQLVAETWPASEGRPEIYSVNRTLEELEPESLRLHSGAGDAAAGLVLGFRGCSMQPGVRGAEPAASHEPPPGTARTCLRAQELFRLSTQRQSVGRRQRRALARLARESSRGSTELYLAAAGSLSMEANRPLPSAPASPSAQRTAFGLGVRMAAEPPPMVKPRFVFRGEDVVLKMKNLGRDNGAAVKSVVIQMRPAFFGRQVSRCPWTKLPVCEAEEGSDVEPCMTTSIDGHGKGRVSVKHLPFARSYQVSVQVKSEAGLSEPHVSWLSTRAGPGLSQEDCAVSHWTCEVESDVKEDIPVGGDSGCSITGSPLPTCTVSKKVSSVNGKPKCFGKRYWRKCRAVMAAGHRSCVNKTAVLGQAKAMQVCYHHHSSSAGAEADRQERCEARGCGRSVFPWSTKTCCCSPGDQGGEDSSSCACVANKCESLGLVPATDPLRSCRH